MKDELGWESFQRIIVEEGWDIFFKEAKTLYEKNIPTKLKDTYPKIFKRMLNFKSYSSSSSRLEGFSGKDLNCQTYTYPGGLIFSLFLYDGDKYKEAAIVVDYQVIREVLILPISETKEFWACFFQKLINFLAIYYRLGPSPAINISGRSDENIMILDTDWLTEKYFEEFLKEMMDRPRTKYNAYLYTLVFRLLVSQLEHTGIDHLLQQVHMLPKEFPEEMLRPEALFQPWGLLEEIIHRLLYDEEFWGFGSCLSPEEKLDEKLGLGEDEKKLSETQPTSPSYEELIKTLIDKRIISYLEKEKEKQTHFPLITPGTPFTNRNVLQKIISNYCDEFLHWVDKYFSKEGLELLCESLNSSKTKEVKILMSIDKLVPIDKIDERFRDLFKNFREEIKNKGIVCELRVITDSKLKSSIHDRWMLSKNMNFNVPSTDTIVRGQYCEVKQTINKPPFEKWWGAGKDIINDWNKIKESLRMI